MCQYQLMIEDEQLVLIFKEKLTKHNGFVSNGKQILSLVKTCSLFYVP